MGAPRAAQQARHGLAAPPKSNPRARGSPKWALAVASAVLLALLGCHVAEAAVVEHWFHVGLSRLDPTCSGMTRDSLVVNGQWPGPTIEAIDGDTLVIHVVNHQEQPVSLHLHGALASGAQWYDGVPGVTQCPLKQGRNFTLTVPLLGQWGTFWYHATTGHTRSTLHGAILVKPPRHGGPIPVRFQIEEDLVVLGSDWYPQSPQELSASVNSAPYPGYPTPTALLINGRGSCGGPALFPVKRYRWYRLRVINAGLRAAFSLQVEGHAMMLLEAEGSYVGQWRLASLEVLPGEAYSVLFETNQDPGSFWISIHPQYEDVDKGVTPGAAVLAYEEEGSGSVLPVSAVPEDLRKKSVEELDAGWDGAWSSMTGLQQQLRMRALFYSQLLSQITVSRLLVLEFHQHFLPSGATIFSANGVRTVLPAGTPWLLSDQEGHGQGEAYRTDLMPPLPPRGLGEDEALPEEGPAVLEVQHGEWVQVVLQSRLNPGVPQAFHVHGHNAFVVAQGAGRFNVGTWQEYPYNLINPVRRNTVAVFPGSWVALRFKASNPGLWAITSTKEADADRGLLAVLKVHWPITGADVGPVPLSQPPNDYPEC